MARKILIRRTNGPSPVLTEDTAANEHELQETIKENPDLLPVDELGLTGPLMIVGRETVLPSGAIDLVGLARGGDLVLCEFKTGPQNPDFRAVVAQLIDYGSDLWRTSFEQFEMAVARRYFESGHCHDARLKGKRTLSDAARAVWQDISDDEIAAFSERLQQGLLRGAFHYVAVAQRFTPAMERTIEYLNATMPVARFYAIELVRFAAADLSAYEARTIVKPNPRGGAGSQPTVALGEAQLIESLEGDAYREAVRELLTVCRSLDLRLEPGTVGASIRMPTSDRAEPISVAWIFPDTKRGWMGLRDLNLGYDGVTVRSTPSVKPALDEYLARVTQLPGAERLGKPNMEVVHFGPNAVVQSHQLIAEILADLVRRANGR